MNIKSLLLGSAAVLTAVSGARAADAVVVAEPEPMEYVRICDVYGAGYYYIPGTETCLKIGGLVRYQISFNEDDNGWRKLTRAELTFTAKSETEYGTLTGHIRLRGDVNSGTSDTYDVAVFTDTNGDGIADSPRFTRRSNDSGVQVQDAWLSLGGVQMGWTDTLYDGDLSGEFDSGGGDRVHFIRYNWDGGNGVTASLSIEEDTNNDNYVPNVVGKVGITQGWGSLTLFAAYDSEDDKSSHSSTTFAVVPPGPSEWALKAIASIKATEALTLEAIATYESGASFFSVGTPAQNAAGAPAGYEWSLGGYAKFAASPKLTVGAGGQYFADQHGNGNDDWAIGAVVDYTIVENFATKLAVNYEDGDSYADGAISGFLRFDRSF